MKNSNRLTFVFFAFYPFYCVAADTAWITSPHTPFFQIKAHVTALGKTHKTYAESHLEHLKKQAETFQLKEKIKKAQTVYLSGNSSKKLFLDITNVAYLGDWKEEQRRIILYAFLRLSQLETNPNGKKAFLISASRFITEDISPEYPEYNLFPPPLIEELNKLRNKQNSFLIKWKKIFPHYEILLVNGKRMPSQSRLNEGKYRVTVLSSSYAPLIQVIDLSALLSGHVKMEPMTKGYCDSLEIKAQWRQKNTSLLKQKNCPKPYVFNSSFSDSKKKKTIRNLPFNKAKKYFLKEKDRGTLKTDLKSKGWEEEKPSFFNRKDLPKWIVIGGTLLTIGIFISLSEPETSSPERKVFH